MTDGDPREIELKLRIPPEALSRLRNHRLLRRPGKAGPVQKRMISTYFDTPDFRLMREQVALRVRKIGQRHIQTVKCAPTVENGINSRSEWEQEVATVKPALKGVGNKRLRKLLSGPKVRKHLAAQFVTDVKRATWPLKRNGSLVEMAIDVGEIKSSKGRVPVCEAEFELKSGPIDGVYALVQELHKSIPFTIEPLSKAERGFALVRRKQPRAQRAQSLTLDKDCTTAQAFQRIGRACLLHLRANEAVVRAARSPEGVHQFRVAIRRLRSALSAFRDLLPRAERRRINSQVRWIAQRFGHARDWDVFNSTLLREVRGRMAGDRSLAAFAAASRGARADAYAAIGETIVAPRYTESLLTLEGWWESGTWAEALGKARDEPAHAYARRSLKKLHRRVVKLGDHLQMLTEPELHELRKRAKKLRYAAEFFRSLFPPKAAKIYIKALSDMQDRLGSLNDAVTAKQLLAELEKRNQGMDPAVLARAAGAISGWCAARVTEDLKQLPAAWANFADTKLFWK
ncbi:MAG: CHAD domain-containing protein [Alphaproteobacteria bacterium]|nr:CHAD domain-containing protein [Alphaproteobacteria bacterium]